MKMKKASRKVLAMMAVTALMSGVSVVGAASFDSVTTEELDASNGNKHLYVNENGINAQAGESNIFVNENGVEITNGLKADSLNATSSNLGDAVADSVTTGELDASNGNKHLFVNENGINAQAGESNIFVNENGVEVTNGLKADVVNADSGVVSGDFEVNNGSTNVYVTENGVQLNKGESSLYVDEYGTTVGTNLKVNEDATITGTANVGTLVADTSVVNGDLDVNAGNKHLFVNEENGIFTVYNNNEQKYAELMTFFINNAVTLPLYRQKARDTYCKYFSMDVFKKHFFELLYEKQGYDTSPSLKGL